MSSININSIYANPGDLISQNFSLTGTQSDYQFYDIRSTWRDPIDWLNVQSSNKIQIWQCIRNCAPRL